MPDTRPEDAALATALGAAYLGLIFAPSARQLTVERAASLLDALSETAPGGARPARVGVFAGMTTDAIVDVVDRLQLGVIQLHGTDGTLFIDRAGYQITPQMRSHADAGAMGSRDAYDDLTGVSMYFTSEAKGERGTTSIQHFPHVRNFLDCVKSRQRPVGDIEIGHRSTTACLLANISYRTGERITWDGKAERITNSARANALLTVKYRYPWKLPGL